MEQSTSASTIVQPVTPESMDATVNIQQLCRLCGSKTTTINRLNIFDVINISIDLPLTIKSCLGIVISDNDNLPKVVCFYCVDKLENFSKFKDTCETTARWFSSLCNQQLSNANLYTEQSGSSNIPPSVSTNVPDSVFIKSDWVETVLEENERDIVSKKIPKKSKKTSKASQRKKEISREIIDNATISNQDDGKGKKSKVYNCNLCSKVCYSRMSIRRHISYKHFPKCERVTCTICNKNFKDNQTLRIHMRSQHEKNFVYVCDLCGQGFMTKVPLDTHIRVKHTNERPFECTQCGKTFASKYVLSGHVSTVHNDGSVQWGCDICKKLFTNKHYLKAHKKNHSISLDERKKIECTICNARFQREYMLKIHMRKHTGEKPYECNQCNNRYDSSKGLKSHMLTHTGERKHVCEVCGSAFALLGNLKIHKLTIHEGIKKFKCKDCGKSYTQNSSLNIHLKKTGHTRLLNP